ncbi:MAG: hypothetical protein E7417_05345 [Ruminococcaceae bacterium]|nr:hypothetical protein [Oscillospiraceae bacterium]
MHELLHEGFHLLEHTLLDTINLIPFLFVTYLLMEYLEHKAGDHTSNFVKKAGRLGPVFGALAGGVPQCGFSAAAANLFTGRVISMGTLIAIFLSTSDEMLPILISEKAKVSTIFAFVGIKMAVGMIAGLIIDLVLPAKADDHDHIHEMCEEEHCHCEKGIFVSAVTHTLHITFFILLITLALNVVMHTVGEEALGNLVLNRPVLGPIVAGVVGLIPNCASSVVLTQLFLNGAMGFGGLMAGLLVNAGIGVLVLFRVNHDMKENFKVLGLLYGIGVVAGMLLGLIPVTV